MKLLLEIPLLLFENIQTNKYDFVKSINAILTYFTANKDKFNKLVGPNKCVVGGILPN